MHIEDIRSIPMDGAVLRENIMSSASSDAFDGSAEPVIYMSENRMPVIIEVTNAIIYIIYAASILAVLVIIPGVRKTRLTSLVGLIAMLTIGPAILMALQGTNWLTGSAELYRVPYGALTSETITGRLEVQIGLSSTNVTLAGQLNNEAVNREKLIQHAAAVKTVDYNERFHWDQPEEMALEHLGALRKGLPYPILTITEFLSQDADGFNWMRKLRQAGHFSSMALYTSLASWCLTAIIMCVLPAYFAHMMQITGGLMIASVWIYSFCIHSPRGFSLQMGNNVIEFSYGFTYVTTFLAGALSIFVGIVLFVLQINDPDKQLTVMDSETYLADQKLAGKLNQTQDKLKGAKEDKIAFRGASVVIPIADIEEQFRPRN